MIRSELKEIKDELNKRYLKDIKWPMRYKASWNTDEEHKGDAPINCSRDYTNSSISGRELKIPLCSEYHQKINLELAKQTGEFGFLLDHVGNFIEVIEVSQKVRSPSSNIEISNPFPNIIGSHLISIDGSDIDPDEMRLDGMKNEEEPSVEKRRQLTRKEMWNLFQDLPSNIKTVELRFAVTPVFSGVLQRKNCFSTYRVWSSFFVLLSHNLLSIYSSEEKCKEQMVKTEKKTVVWNDQLMKKNGIDCREMEVIDPEDAQRETLGEIILPHHAARCFIVKSCKKTWIFQADNLGSKKEWIMVLKNASSFAKGC